MSIFSSPAAEAELTSAQKLKRAETQQKTFDKLQTLAAAKVKELGEFLQFEVIVLVEEVKGKIGGLELAYILQEKPGPAPVHENSSVQ